MNQVPHSGHEHLLMKRERNGLDVQRRPVAANPLRGHSWGHLQMPEKQNSRENRYLDGEFGGQSSNFLFINQYLITYIKNICEYPIRRKCLFMLLRRGYCAVPPDHLIR